MSVNQHRINELVSAGMQAGAAVLASDGKQLGEVREIEGPHFRVDAPLERDYWLSLAYVVSADAGRVVMSFPASEVGPYKVSASSMDEGLKAGPGGGEVILSETEQREQRERMARELAEQRRRLPHDHAEGRESPPVTAGGTVGEPVERELSRLERLGEDALDARLAGHTGEGIGTELARETVAEATEKIDAGTLPMAPFPSVEATARPAPDFEAAGDARRAPPEGAERALATGHGVYWLVAGLWPLLHVASFQGVTGRKHDLWLVKTVASLVVVAGAVLTMAGLRGRVTPETRMLAMGAPAALTAIDIWYTRKGRISRIYLVDAVVHGALVVAWGVMGLRSRRQ